MANELACVYPTGNTLYTHVFDATGQIWNGAAFEAINAANWANYDIATAEVAGSTQVYQATMPGATAGAYSFVVRKQAGGSPAVADIAVAEGSMQWDGSAESTLDEIRDDTNELQTDWVNGGRLDLLLDATLADTGELQTDWTNGGRLDLLIDAIKAVTDNLPNGGALSDLATILIDTNEIQGKLPSKSYLAGSADADGGIDNTEAAVIQGECNDALVAQKLDHLVAVAESDDPADNSIIAKLAASDGDWSGFSAATDALEAIRDKQADIETDTAEIGAAGAGLTAVPWNAAWDTEVESECTDALNTYDPPTKAELDSGLAGLNDPTAAAVADAVWDEASAGHTDAGKAGEQLWTDVNAILADTNELQGDWVDTGRLDTLIDAIKERTDNLPDDPADDSDIDTQLTAIKVDTAAILVDTGTDGVVIVDGGITAAKIAADAITSSELATSAAQEIADEILKRGVSNVENAADAASLAAVILAAFESKIDGTIWTIYKTDHSTTFTTRTVTPDSNADAIVEVT